MLQRARNYLATTPLVAIALFILVALLPQLGLDNYWQRQIILVATYALLCSGLNLSFGYAGELALGQVAVFAAGAYTSGILYKHGHTDVLLGLVIAVAVAAFAGLLSGIPGLRLSGWSLAVVSFFLVLLITSFTTIFESETGGAIGLAGVLKPSLLGQPLSQEDFYLTAIAVTMLWLVIFRNLIVSRFGDQLRVLATSPTLTRTLGGSVYRVRVQAYVLGALPAGLAGVLYTYLTGFISPDAFKLDVLIAVLAATIVGGAASVWGAPVGAALLVLGPLQMSSLAQYSTAVYGAFLVVIGAGFSGGLAALANKLRRNVFRRFAGQSDLTVLAGRRGQEAFARQRDQEASARQRDQQALAPIADPSSSDALTIPGERLVVAGLKKSFGGLRALTGVDLVAEPGAITAIIGANGAGKTTLLNVISGLIPADEGRVELANRRLTGMTAQRVSQVGVGRTFQTPIIPEAMSVLDVVQTGRLRHGGVGFFGAILRLPSFLRVRRQDRQAAMAALSFAGLAHLADQEAGHLPLGTRRLLEVVRSVAGEPNVLLLDEPAAGLDETSLEELGSLLRRIRDAGGTVVLVEHNIPFVMEVADHVYVMELGRVIASGEPSVIRDEQRVIDSYLGRRGRLAAAVASLDHDLDNLANS